MQLSKKDCDILIDLLFSQVVNLSEEELDEIVSENYFKISSKEEVDNLYLKLLDLQNDLIRIERGQKLSPTRMRYYNG